MREFIFASHLFNISRGFNLTNWLLVDFLRAFIFENFSIINALYILTFLLFVLQLVLYDSWNSFSNFSIFQIVLFGCKKLNSRMNAEEEIKRGRYRKKIYIFFDVASAYIFWYHVKYFWHDHCWFIDNLM